MPHEGLIDRFNNQEHRFAQACTVAQVRQLP